MSVLLCSPASLLLSERRMYFGAWLDVHQCSPAPSHQDLKCHQENLMSTPSLPVRNPESAPTASRTGMALAMTVALFYTLCAVVWLAAPGPFLNFMNGLFHGMDFSALVRPAPFSWAGFLEALVVLSVWAFLAGSFFGWLRRRLGS